MPTEFLDRTEGSEHERFQQWRTSHQTGVFLTMITERKARLHGARCQHLGAGPPYYSLTEHPDSLTAKRKVCAPQSELLEWAKEHEVTVLRCQHCERDGLIGNETAGVNLPRESSNRTQEISDEEVVYLLTWNPRNWPWTSLTEDLARFRQSGSLTTRWSCGRSRQIRRGDRAYLMRLGIEPKGIIGSGYVTHSPYEQEHWDEERAAAGDAALFVDVRFDHLSEEPLIVLAELEEPPFAGVIWTPQGSGIRIPAPVSDALEQMWAQRTGPLQRPEEFVGVPELVEGAVHTVTVNVYERNVAARRICLSHYGRNCFACGFSFEDFYGEQDSIGLHVHHVRPMSEGRHDYVVDPIQDLRPLCPNCHTAIHLTSPIISPEVLRDRIRERRQRSSENSRPRE